MVNEPHMEPSQVLSRLQPNSRADRLQSPNLWEKSETEGLSEALQYQQTECSERERVEQWGLIRSRDSSDIFISSNTLSHWEPWRSPICSMTDCSPGSNAALVEMFKSFIKQLCQSPLHCRVVRHQCTSKVLLCTPCTLLAVTTQNKYPLIPHASTYRTTIRTSVPCWLSAALKDALQLAFQLSHKGFLRFLSGVQTSVQTECPLLLLACCWVGDLYIPFFLYTMKKILLKFSWD